MILIKNGLLIDPANSVEGNFDILVENGKISKVLPKGKIDAKGCEEIIDATGKWVVPGLIDLHVHLREPGFEWKETVASGSRAAIAGGYTSICCMPNTKPVNDKEEVVKYILDKARAAGLARVYPIGAVSIGQCGETMAPYSELKREGCVAFSDDGKPVMNSLLMRRALEWCSMIDIPIAVHEEDCSLCDGGVMNESALSSRLGYSGMPKAAEDVMVARDIELARLTNARLHFCHVSSARSVDLIRNAKAQGIRITAEVTPHHLTLSEEAVLEFDADAKMNPPLRGSSDIEACIAGLADGTLDSIATDHAPHELDKKRIEFGLAAFGIIGLQTALPLTLELVRKRHISRMRAIEALSTAPAKAFALPGGGLGEGSLADITIIDPEIEWHFSVEKNESLSNNSPWIGRKFTGAADTVLVGGNVLYASGAFREK